MESQNGGLKLKGKLCFTCSLLSAHHFRQLVSQDEHVFSRNSTWIGEDPGMAEPMGLRTYLWIGFGAAMGSSILGRILKRFDDIHELLYHRTLVTWWVTPGLVNVDAYPLSQPTSRGRIQGLWV